MAKESGRVKSILAWLNASEGIKCVKNHGSVFSQAGNPDIFGSREGMAFVLEVKNDEGELSQLQKFRLREWYAAGAICGAVKNTKEAADIVFKRVKQGPESWPF